MLHQGTTASMKPCTNVPAAGQAEVPLLVVSGDRDYTPVDYKRA